MSIIHIIMTFYKRDTMLYVGKKWQGTTGYLLLFSLCAYCAIFISYSWSKQAKSTYENFYRPIVAQLPPVKYSNDHFQFDAQMPVKIEHPISGTKAVYIDTSVSDIPKEAEGYRAIITKDLFIIYDIPIMPRSHSLTHNVVFFLFVKSPLDYEQFTAPSEFISVADQIAAKSHYGIYIMVLLLLLFTEACKTLFISLIVMFMFKNGGMGTRVKKEFKLVNRLCILTYLPVLLTNSFYFFMMSTPGIFMLIVTSFIHIILLMTAIQVNTSKIN